MVSGAAAASETLSDSGAAPEVVSGAAVESETFSDEVDIPAAVSGAGATSRAVSDEVATPEAVSGAVADDVAGALATTEALAARPLALSESGNILSIINECMNISG